MEEWKEYRFTDVASLTNGRAYLQPELQSVGKYKIVRVGNLSGGDKWFYSDMELPQEKYCNKGDLLYAWACSFGPYIWEGDKTIYHYHIWKVDVNSAVADKMFLYYYLKYYTPKWMGFTNGSVMMHITKGSLEKQIVSLPSLPTQQKIASILSSLDEKIEVNRRINDNLEQQAQALYKQWFVNKRQKEWNMGVVSDYYDITIGKTPPRKEKQWFSFNEKDRVWVSISDMGTCGIFINNSSEYLTSEAISKFNVKIVPNNTVLLSFKLTVGRVAISDGIMTTNEAIAHFNTDKEYLLEYTYLALKAYEFSNLGSTSSIATAVNSKIIKTMSWMMPDDATLYKFHDLTSPIFIKIKNNIRENQKLITLRDTLLPKLMSGELSVNDVSTDLVC